MTTHSPRHSVQSHLAASLTAYLEDLQESGLDGIPLELMTATTAAMPPLHHTAPAGQGKESAMNDEPVVVEKHESLEQIRKSLGECQRCKLGATRKSLVFGVGNPTARLVFVGEGPGADEDTQGEPFVGDAGKMLNRIIAAMELTREEVYICNVVKCRPPQNRPPEADEVTTCSPFLLRQIQSIKPEVIVALGSSAAQALLQIKVPISKLRGKFHDFHGIPLMPTYHPSYLLRTGGNSDSFWSVWEDMTQVLQLLKLPVPNKSRNK
ncbi:MAG: uracil-DNA glycosylase [Desulfuromonadaceae bacterium]|nr:uracil-DNA glycosylase [Desulfuromonadaceae bacterium]MDD2848056.1 uracil-DNA glycosylase [Desulfuromonadaceae bacterium]MDD4132103.1 uracil-DNA glycosylase [Desulfuromonadaceae bacterium]